MNESCFWSKVCLYKGVATFAPYAECMAMGAPHPSFSIFHFHAIAYLWEQTLKKRYGAEKEKNSK